MPTRVHELLELPDAVRKGDFVQGLTEGIQSPAETVRNYAITPKILDTFRHALSVVDSALRDNRSQAVYLHGSFGSGKSHFMALLDLMLDNQPQPWERTELHALREKYTWIGKKKLLQLPIHMLGATSMESKILGSYVRWAQKHHPDAPMPAVYSDQKLFEDARALRAKIGDEAFFKGLNGDMAKVNAGWGKLATKVDWDAQRFDAAAGAAYTEDDRDPENPRAKLFSDLVRTYFTAFSTQDGRFIDLDAGLGVVSRHAQGLGYDAVVLYLDELILWLAGHSSDLPFVGREAQKMVKLKEAQDAERAIPIVSFIARQRDLSQFLGEQAQGAIRTELTKNLSHHEGRFETITLADSNLPAIVQHRVVRPKNELAAKALAEDFQKTWRAAGQAKSVLIGSEGDEADFKKVYPFSPALVEALVALSDCLQRERTAIRILMELLVDHLTDLELGRVVPVGDAFDALAGGTDPIDDPVMRARFERAKDLYLNQFLPLIRIHNRTDSAEACQRLRPDADVRLGCSGCQQRACRNDNRLAKTLLMAALVPKAKPFVDLTVGRLVHLNHGTIASPIPGAEIQVATQRLREWASQISAIRLGDQADPTVSVHLEGVDVGPILAQAAEADSPGARKVTLRRLLFGALGLPGDSNVVETDVSFFGTRRRGRVRFANVRELDGSALVCPTGTEWQLILDYPFDERGHGPDEDVRALEQFQGSRPPGTPQNPTVVWLPTFFSHALERELGYLVQLEHILDGDPRKYLSGLRPEDQDAAKADLTSLRGQKEALIERTLAQAYGLTQAQDTPNLDPSRAVDEHLVPLLDGLDLRPVLAANMKDGLARVVDLLLYKRYPHHPKFGDGVSVTATRMERVRGLVERLIDEREHKLAVDRTERAELRALADPLGLTEGGEAVALLRDQPLRDLEQKREQMGIETPSVGMVRTWLDPERTRGLTREVQDVLIALYAQWSGRMLQGPGRTFELPKPGQLQDDVELVRPELPTQTEWTEALARAGKLFGIALSGHSLGAQNLGALVEKVKGAATRHTEVAPLVPVLETRSREWGCPDSSPRLTTARSCARLVQSLVGASGAALVRTLAGFKPETSLSAMERSLTVAREVKARLEEDARWIVFQQVRHLEADAEKGKDARALLADLTALLSADQLNAMLADGLTALTQRAARLLAVPEPAPPVSGEEVFLDASKELQGGVQAAAELRALADRMESEDLSRVRIHVTAWHRKG